MIVPPYRSVKHYKLMKDNKSSSSVIDNFLSTEEIQYLYKWWQDHRRRETSRGDISQIQIGNKGQVPKGTLLGNLRYSYAYEELKEILQPKNVESTALGACIVAMSASGENLNEIKISDVDIYKPNVENIKISKKSYKEWKSYLIHSMSSNK